MSKFIGEYASQILIKISEHLYISGVSVFFGILVAVPLGCFLSKFKHFSTIIISVVSFLQTIPALALLSLMIPLFGVGKSPAILALFLYSLLPILRNTFVGIKSVDAIYIDAARGMGMSKLQVLLQIEIPLSLNVIISGIRISSIYVISWATLASYIGGGGLGDFIFNGLTLYKTDLLLMGAIPVTCLALFVDFLFRILEKHITLSIGKKEI